MFKQISSGIILAGWLFSQEKSVMLRKFFVKLKKGTEYLNYGHHIVQAWGVREYAAALVRKKESAVEKI